MIDCLTKYLVFQTMGRRAVDTTISLIVSVFLVSVLMYLLVYSVTNVPVKTSKRDLESEEGANNSSNSSNIGELPLCPRKPEFFSECLLLPFAPSFSLY